MHYSNYQFNNMKLLHLYVGLHTHEICGMDGDSASIILTKTDFTGSGLGSSGSSSFPLFNWRAALLIEHLASSSTMLQKNTGLQVWD